MVINNRVLKTGKMSTSFPPHPAQDNLKWVESVCAPNLAGPKIQVRLVQVGETK